jgi:hypothetical protein
VQTHTQRCIDEFFSHIEPWRRAYTKARLQYLAIQDGERWLVLNAALHIAVVTNRAPLPLFRTEKIQAGQWDLPTDVSVEQVIEALTSHNGFYVDGHGTLVLAPEPDRGYSAYQPAPLHPDGLNHQSRFTVLMLTGAQRHEFTRQPETDWQLKSARIPYESLQELAFEYVGRYRQGDLALLEVIAGAVVEVSAGSRVQGEKAQIGLWMAAGLDLTRSRLGFRVLHSGTVQRRDSIDGEALTWHDQGSIKVGMATISVPSGALIDCVASYAGHAHHHQWLADPSLFQNPRYAAFSHVDEGRDLLSSYLFPSPQARGKASGDFEDAIAWLLWALGFAPMALGSNDRTRDAPDIVATTPAGHFVLVECTLGQLKAESKLSLLAGRAAALRRELSISGFTSLQVLPVAVTALPRAEVQQDLDWARRHGIVVATRETLEQAMIDVRQPLHADRIYSEAVESLQPPTDRPLVG